MDVNVLLERSQHGANGGDPRLHHPVQMTADPAYGMNQGPGLNHHPGMQSSHALPYMMAPALPQPVFATNSYMPRQDSQSTLDDESYTPAQSKSGSSTKIYPCSYEDCDKSFARRSDLSRHGKLHDRMD
jgi:hypothetical protein